MTAIATSVSTTRSTTRPQGWKRYRARTFYGFISPWLLGFVLLTLFPLGYALWLRLYDVYERVSRHSRDHAGT